jgi:phage tail sheath protein FI
MATAYLSPGVYVEEVDRGSKPIEGVGTAVAAFVGFAEKGPVEDGQPSFKPTLITNWSQFSNTFGGFVKGGFLASAVYGYFNNGGGTCYVTRLPGEITNGQSNGHEKLQAMAALPSRSNAALQSLEFSALESTAAASGEITIEVRPPDEGAPEDQFTLVVKRGELLETYPNVTLGRSRNARNVVDVVNRESKMVKVAEREITGSLSERVPAVGTYPLARVEPSSLAKPAGPTLPAISPKEILGEAADRTGIAGLETLDNVTMVCVPDLMAAHLAGHLSAEGVRAVQTALMNHCELMKDRVAIVDAPPNMNAQQIREWRMNVAGYDSKYAALYYPWIRVADPLGESDSILVPPSGHMAGIWARNDSERGVHKAPANEIVRGALGLEIQLGRGEQDTLNPIGVNCIRAFPGRGIRVWGARTLSSDPAWRYLNVRRLFNFVEKSIDNGTQWVVFEPNDMDLWERVKRNISAFLTRVWADGALFGAAAGDAFFVKCDAELNTEDVRDAGQLLVEIGIAPVKPAEFVIFRISQYSPAAGL